MKYEYDFEVLKLTPEQEHAVGLGYGLESLNVLLKETINKRASGGWEPLYPWHLSLPVIWFKKEKRGRKV